MSVLNDLDLLGVLVGGEGAYNGGKAGGCRATSAAVAEKSRGITNNGGRVTTTYGSPLTGRRFLLAQCAASLEVHTLL